MSGTIIQVCWLDRRLHAFPRVIVHRSPGCNFFFVPSRDAREHGEDSSERAAQGKSMLMRRSGARVCVRASLSEARFGVPVRNLLYLLLATGWLLFLLPSHFLVFNISL